MDSLIPISYDNPERPTVSGRELHEFLNIETPYAKWFGRMVEGGFSPRVRTLQRWTKMSSVQMAPRCRRFSTTTSLQSRWPKNCA